MSDKKNIYQRVAQVMAKVAYIRKDKAVENYMAVTHDMVTAMVRPHFLEAGIVISPRVLTAQMVDTGRKSKSGNPAMRYEGRFQVDFVNIDDPADRITVELDAQADDYGDKAPGKALSYATKYAVLKLLMLETGENEEGRLAPEEVPLSTSAEQRLVILRDASLEGMAALEKAWHDAGKELRKELANHLNSLQVAAAKADAATRSDHAT
jgi:hypothetical protein